MTSPMSMDPMPLAVCPPMSATCANPETLTSSCAHDSYLDRLAGKRTGHRRASGSQPRQPLPPLFHPSPPFSSRNCIETNTSSQRPKVAPSKPAFRGGCRGDVLGPPSSAAFSSPHDPEPPQTVHRQSQFSAKPSSKLPHKLSPNPPPSFLPQTFPTQTPSPPSPSAPLTLHPSTTPPISPQRPSYQTPAPKTPSSHRSIPPDSHPRHK